MLEALLLVLAEAYASDFVEPDVQIDFGVFSMGVRSEHYDIIFEARYLDRGTA